MSPYGKSYKVACYNPKGSYLKIPLDYEKKYVITISSKHADGVVECDDTSTVCKELEVKDVMKTRTLYSMNPKLEEFIGVEPGTLIDRNDVTKSIHKYINENNLKEPLNPRIVKPDETLKDLLNLTPNDEVSYFTLQKNIRDANILPKENSVKVCYYDDEFVNIDDNDDVRYYY